MRRNHIQHSHEVYEGGDNELSDPLGRCSDCSFHRVFLLLASLADVPPKELSRLWNSTSSVCFTANENQEAMAGGWMDLPALRNRCGLEGTEDRDAIRSWLGKNLEMASCLGRFGRNGNHPPRLCHTPVEKSRLASQPLSRQPNLQSHDYLRRENVKKVPQNKCGR